MASSRLNTRKLYFHKMDKNWREDFASPRLVEFRQFRHNNSKDGTRNLTQGMYIREIPDKAWLDDILRWTFTNQPFANRKISARNAAGFKFEHKVEVLTERDIRMMMAGNLYGGLQIYNMAPLQETDLAAIRKCIKCEKCASGGFYETYGGKNAVGHVGQEFAYDCPHKEGEDIDDQSEEKESGEITDSTTTDTDDTDISSPSRSSTLSPVSSNFALGPDGQGTDYAGLDAGTFMLFTTW